MATVVKFDVGTDWNHFSKNFFCHLARKLEPDLWGMYQFPATFVANVNSLI